MQSLPKSWIAVPYKDGTYSRGQVHEGVVPGVPILGQHFNGVYCVGRGGGNDTFVVSGNSEGGNGYDLCVIRRNYPNESETVRKFETAGELFQWILAEGGAPLPRETLEEIATPSWLDGVQYEAPPSYAVHTYAVVRVKTIGDSPLEGETIQDFAQRVSDAVAGQMHGIRVRGLHVPGSDVEAIEYAEEVSAVLVDKVTYGEDGEERTESSFFDDHMEPNDGNGTDPARYARLERLVKSIAATPLQGEPCADAPGGTQSWTDREHVLERLTEIVNQCRKATKKESS